MPRGSEHVRQAYVSLIQDIQDSREELIDPTSNSLSSCLKRANALYKDVHTAREQALDSQTLTLISHTAVDKLQRFRTDFKDKHEPIQFVNKLKQWLGSNVQHEEDNDEEYGESTQNPHQHSRTQQSSVDWDLLGKKVSPYVNETPSTDFMYGQLAVPEKQKRKVNRKQKERTEPIRVATEGIDTANQVGKETTKHIEHIFKTISKEKKMNLYDLAVNVDDFGQTVENFFYISFLVKDGHVRMKEGDGEPIIELGKQPSKEDYTNGSADKKQCVVRIDYPLWQRVVAEKQLQKSFLPHRDYNNFIKATEARRKRLGEYVEEESAEEEEEEEGEGEEEEEITAPTSQRKSSQTSHGKRSQRTVKGEMPERKRRKKN